jgi:hypothetical protein
MIANGYGNGAGHPGLSMIANVFGAVPGRQHQPS